MPCNGSVVILNFSVILINHACFCEVQRQDVSSGWEKLRVQVMRKWAYPKLISTVGALGVFLILETTW